ncbi:MAG: DUF2062 domain-containing protein [Victivallales bacterium]|nr:DUF2062 domain-containing protein [Victivallales bacterium]
MRFLLYLQNAGFSDLKRIGESEFVSHVYDGVEGEFASAASLRDAARIADESDCEMVAILPEGARRDDLERLVAVLPDADRPTGLVIGARSGENRETRENTRVTFMLQLLTGERIVDFGSSLRIYPTKLLLGISDKIYDSPYWNIEVLISASRSGYALRHLDVNYSGVEPSDSSDFPKMPYFIPKLLAPLVPIPRKRLCERNFQKEAFKEFLLHPLKFIGFLLRENASPSGLAAAAATGMFLGTLPLFGFHTITIIYVSVKLRLNKVMSVNISHLCMPPCVPIACVELGHYALNGKWLVLDSMHAAFGELKLRLLEWVVGSLILAPLNAVVFWFLTYAVASVITRRRGVGESVSP